MRRLRVKLAIGVAAIGVVVTAAAAVAGDHARVKTALTGYEETPQAISTDGNGTLDVTISNGGDAIDYELTYDDLEGGAVQQAHIHFGQEGVTGGVSAFLLEPGQRPGRHPGVPAAAGDRHRDDHDRPDRRAGDAGHRRRGARRAHPCHPGRGSRTATCTPPRTP